MLRDGTEIIEGQMIDATEDKDDVEQKELAEDKVESNIVDCFKNVFYFYRYNLITNVSDGNHI